MNYHFEKNIFELFESEFGRTLSPMEYEFINAWINSGMKEMLDNDKLDMAARVEKAHYADVAEEIHYIFT